MLSCRYNFAIRGHIRGLSDFLHSIAGHRRQRHSINWVAEKSDRITIFGVGFPFDHVYSWHWEDNTVYSTAKQTIGPVRQQVTDIDQYRGSRVIICARGRYRHWRPITLLSVDLKSGLTLQSEEEGY